jgi:hypothetical protein
LKCYEKGFFIENAHERRIVSWKKYEKYRKANVFVEKILKNGKEEQPEQTY